MSKQQHEQPDTAAILAALAPTQTEHGASRWKALLECEEKHRLHYVERLRPVGGSTSMEQELGILVHACLNYVAEGLILAAPGAPLRDWADVLQTASLIVDEADRALWDPFSIQEAERLLTGYDAHWGTANLGFPGQVLITHAETAMEAELAPGLLYSCRHDLIVEALGEPVVVDHKTRARARSTAGDLERELRADPSVIGQSWLAQQTLGLDNPPPVWLNDIIKTKIPAFERHLVRVEARDVEAWKLAMIQRLGYEQERAAAGAPAQRNPYACAPYFGKPCHFFKYCHGAQEERDLNYEVLPTSNPASPGSEQ